jgi:hypothetical protein
LLYSTPPAAWLYTPDNLHCHACCTAHILQVLYMQSQDEAQRMMVVDEKLKIMHCSESLAKMLGASTSTLTTMQLSALIAPPAAQLHKRWMLVSNYPPQTVNWACYALHWRSKHILDPRRPTCT